VILVGHDGHDEVVGTMGEAPEAILLVETIEQARAVEPADPARVAYVTQTTLSVDETAEIVRCLRERFPTIVAPRKEDICYATTKPPASREGDARLDRPAARDRLAQQLELEPARRDRPGRRRRRLPDRRRERDRRDLARASSTIGVTSGASAPERLVSRVCDWFRARGVTDIAPFASRYEDVFFKLPVELRRAPRGLPPRFGDADHAVARHERGQLLLAHPVGARRPARITR